MKTYPAPGLGAHFMLLCCFASGMSVLAADAPTGFPFGDETLRYSVNWPSGLSLGEGQFRAKRVPEGWDFSFTLSAAIPTYSVTDTHRALATSELCSLRLEKDSIRGSRKTREVTVFDASTNTATRETLKGGKSEFSIPACPRDALAFLFHTRRELGQGRVPPPQEVFFGAAYRMQLVYTGARTLTIGGRKAVTDHIQASVKGPKSDWSFEMFFARDAARTPLLIRVPFTLGSFSLELIR
jgi:hypothetical protein